MLFGDMDYAFENLGADRFQEFCQALILRENPNLKCLPTGQADGGRDAVALTGDAGIVIYQMKFARKDLADREANVWLNKTIRDELESIKRLVEKGVKRYVLVTNVRG